MKRNYECMVLLDNREVRQGWDQLKETVSAYFTKHGGEIVSAKLWEERRLCYPINHQLRGTYMLVYFNSDTGNITAMNRELQMAEPVMRHTVAACEEIPESAHEPEAEFDVSKIGQEPEPEPEASEEESSETEGGEEASKEEASSEDAPKEEASSEETPEPATADTTSETKEES